MQTNKIARFWQEIKRRNVHRSFAVYCGTAFMIYEAANLIFPRWGLPDWTFDFLLYILILGAIITVIVSWVYDVSKEGIEKTGPVERAPEKAQAEASRSWKIATYVSLVAIIGLILFNILSPSWMSRYQRNIEPSIAVLPFDNLSYDADQLWFTEGFSVVIISQLSKIAGLRVIQRNSTERYKEKTMSIADIGKELGVNFIVDGTILKQGNRIRVVPKLIRVKNETHLWSEVYDSNYEEEIFDIQTEIAKEVASNLHTALSPEEEEKIEHFGTDDPEAWEYYMKGNHLMQELTEMNTWKAIVQYKQAIELDENFAQAYAGLAYAYFQLTTWDVAEPDFSLIPVAKKWAFKSLELNENLGEPHYVLGAIEYIHDWDWKAAEKAFRLGMELDPNIIWGRTLFANFLSFMNRFEEAMAVSEGSIELNPRDPYGYLELVFPYWNLGETEKAIELLYKCLELHPEFYNAKWGLALYYAEQEGEKQYAYDYCQEQLERFQNDLQRTPAQMLGYIGVILVLAGGKEAVNEILSELHRRVDAKEKDISYGSLGRIYAALGEPEIALDYLEESIKIREPFAFAISAGIPVALKLRSNPRYQDLLKSIGIELYNN